MEKEKKNIQIDLRDINFSLIITTVAMACLYLVLMIFFIVMTN